MKHNQINLFLPQVDLNNILFWKKNKTFLIRLNYLKSFNYLSYIKKIFTKYFFIKIKKNITKKSTKHRFSVEKSNKKPWQQKGLGKARAGSYKSPLWRGGASIFGPLFKRNKFKCLKKLNYIFFNYLLINRRSNILVINLFTTINTFCSFKDYINRQLRLKGIFSKNIIFIKFDKNKINFLDSDLKEIKYNFYINYLLKSQYIIILI